jgi:hypothetical protein
VLMPFPLQRRSLASLAPLIALVAVVLSMSVELPTAQATDYTWSGGGEAAFTADNWSNGENWSGATAPPASSSIGTLTFPELTSGACTASPPTDVCYLSQNDVSNLSVNSIAIDSGVPYVINGNPITLGSGGIAATYAAATPALPSLNVPLTLAAPQTWTIDGGWLSVGKVTGNTDALDLDMSSGATLALAFGDAEVGSVAVTGENPSDIGATAEYNGVVHVGVADTNDGLNGIDGNPISLTDAALVAAFSSTVGSLSTTGGLVGVGYPGASSGSLSVNGSVTLDPTSVLQAFIAHPGTTPATDYSQLSASGTVNLGGAGLQLIGADPSTEACLVLNPGDVDTLVTTSGNLEGTFAGIPNGSVIPLSCTPGEPATVRISYTAHAVTATVVQAGSSSSPSGGGSSSGGGSTTTGTPSTGSSAGTGSSSGGATPVITISSAQLAASLASQLIPTGKTAKIAALLKAGGLTMSFKALEAGTLVVGWYDLPTGAKLATHSKAKPVLVASGQMTFPAAGTGKLKVRLTAAGRKLLKHATKVKLTAKGVFTVAGKVPVSVAKTVLLRR